MIALSNGVLRASLLILFGAVPFIQPFEAAAQSGKFTGTGKFVTSLAETTMLPGDKPGHELALGSRLDANTNSDPIFGSGQAMLVGVSDLVAETRPSPPTRAPRSPRRDKARIQRSRSKGSGATRVGLGSSMASVAVERIKGA